MTKKEAQIEEAAKILADLIDYDIPRKVVMSHCRLAVKTLIAGLDLSQEVSESGTIGQAVAIEYHRPNLY
jgi:hypothetical protein